MSRTCSRPGHLAAALLLLALASAWPAPAPAAGSDPLLANAIYVAGRQRMLEERIVKAWCLLGIANENRQLFEAIELFEEYLAELQAFVADHPDRAAGLADVERRWRPFERLASAEPARGKALALLNSGEQLLAASERLVRSLARPTGRDEAQMLALASRQRMLTQKLAKTYCYLAWGFDVPDVVQQFVDTWGEFELAHTRLLESGLNTPPVTGALERAREEWEWYKSALSLYQDKAYYPGIIDNAGEKILLEMEQVTALYASLLATRSER